MALPGANAVLAQRAGLYNPERLTSLGLKFRLNRYSFLVASAFDFQVERLERFPIQFSCGEKLSKSRSRAYGSRV